jgi:hypothetical protein
VAETTIKAGSTYTAKTDTNGTFIIEGVLLGKYKIYAGNNARGYPESLSSIYQGSVRNIMVDVIENQASPQYVTFVLGPQLDQINAKIEDEVTKKPITNAEVTVRLLDAPENFSTTGVDEKGRLRLVAPSVAFTLEVSASGFADWRSSKLMFNLENKGMQSLRGRAKEMVIQLRPE